MNYCEVLDNLNEIRNLVHSLAELSIQNDWRKYGQVETDIIDIIADTKAALLQSNLMEAD